MRLFRPLAATVALSMVATPVFAQSAAPLSLAPTGAQLQQANGLEGNEYLFPAIVIFGILAAAILFTSNQDHTPQSP